MLQYSVEFQSGLAVERIEKERKRVTDILWHDDTGYNELCEGKAAR